MIKRLFLTIVSLEVQEIKFSDRQEIVKLGNLKQRVADIKKNKTECKKRKKSFIDIISNTISYIK